jgi:sulfite reductase (NADPH) flavoprotein alpha-component
MDPLSLRLALEERLDLGKAPAELLQALGVDPENRDLHVLDALLIGKPLAGPAAAGLLRPLQARLYSIASSPKAHKEEIHLTVGAVRYEAHGRPRKGACSTFLAERALAAGSARVYLHRNNGFRLPSSGDTPVILIGPGTGIAPFRAFLQERAATGATGGSWLFFGDQRESEDFLYREEILAWRSSGKLDRLDLAWSRDQARKIYVQDRMREQAGELWSWLQRGAHVYVCGDASRMAKDVDNTLLEIASARLGNDRTKATEFLAGLRASRRYQRDVY